MGELRDLVDSVLWRERLMAFEATGGRKATRAMLLKDRPNCHWCKADFSVPSTYDWKEYPNNIPTIDHIKPTCEGGTDDYDNLALACSRCNSTRAGGRPPHLVAKERVYRFLGLISPTGDRGNG